MTVSYKRLWKLLIDRNISKVNLRQMTGIAPSTFSRMNKSEFISLEIVAKICKALDCSVDDILEFKAKDEV